MYDNDITLAVNLSCATLIPSQLLERKCSERMCVEPKKAELKVNGV